MQVTLVTGSGSKLRITQSYIDGKAGKLHVHMTRTVDFAEGDQKNCQEALTVMSWLIGETTGITT